MTTMHFGYWGWVEHPFICSCFFFVAETGHEGFVFGGLRVLVAYLACDPTKRLLTGSGLGFAGGM